MSFVTSAPTQTARQRLPFPYQAESAPLTQALGRLEGLTWASVVARATPWVEQVRAHPAPFWAMESLLKEYPISSAEGLALMRLAEALLRVPDAETAIALTADQLGHAQFSGEGEHAMLAKLSSQAIALAKHWLPASEGDGAPAAKPGLLQRLGELEEAHMFNTFNMGVGMTITLPTTQANQALALLHAAGVSAYVIGEVVPGDAGIALC